MAIKFGKSAPWVEYYREVEALFSEDPQVKVIYDEDDASLKLLVDDAKKAEALTELLPVEKTFGNISLPIEVVPSNLLKKTPKINLIYEAFKDNEAVSYIEQAPNIFTNPIYYVVFKKKVVQYFNDDLSDAHGVRSTLYQDIAKDVLGEEAGVYFCTDTREINSLCISTSSICN